MTSLFKKNVSGCYFYLVKIRKTAMFCVLDECEEHPKPSSSQEAEANSVLCAGQVGALLLLWSSGLAAADGGVRRREGVRGGSVVVL